MRRRAAGANADSLLIGSQRAVTWTAEHTAGFPPRQATALVAVVWCRAGRPDGLTLDGTRSPSLRRWDRIMDLLGRDGHPHRDRGGRRPHGLQVPAPALVAVRGHGRAAGVDQPPHGRGLAPIHWRPVEGLPADGGGHPAVLRGQVRAQAGLRPGDRRHRAARDPARRRSSPRRP
ncbi:hypothetical protein QJS66_07705 [Kocuria rhizophila]|nr:hypothetical protein QJS66_07705 [Kocuria rhizophila]